MTLAICDRCRLTFKRKKLVKDGNTPGLRVCRECRDNINPYRLPPRKPDPIALPWTRPLTSIVPPIYVNEGTPVLSPYQNKFTPLSPNQDTQEYVLAKGNIAPPSNDPPLPNEVQLPPLDGEEYLPPRLKR